MTLALLKCKKCGDIIYSKSRHDFVLCQCESVAVDGGNDYFKISGNENDYEILSIDQLIEKAKTHDKCLKDIRAEIERVVRTCKTKAEMFVALESFLNKKMEDK